MGDAIMLQWTLSQTVDNFLKVGRDLIRAASADNVQPLTLLSCSRFGATLAISSITRSKIQMLLKSQSDPVLVKFLKAHVGYATGDSVDVLSQSMAGINTLALAAALIAISSNFEAGCALEIMIIASAADKSIVPTAHHLKDLLDVLEPRLIRAGFLSETLSWRDWWAHNGGNVHGWAVVSSQSVAYPSPEGIHQIVASFRELARVGEASSIVFTVGSCAPWLTAFIKWCIGLPPTIYDQEGNVLLEQEGSCITLLYSGDIQYVKKIKIEICHEYNSITEVIYASVLDKDGMRIGEASGMVDLPTFARSSIERQRLHDGIGRRALLQALPYALKQVCDLCIVGGYSSNQPKIESLRIQEFKPFPEDIKISNVMTNFISFQGPTPLKSLEEDVLVADLPLIKLWAEAEKSGLSDLQLEPEHEFITRLSYIVADIMALGLFDNSLDHIMLYYPNSYTVQSTQAIEWVYHIRDILLDGRPRQCPTIAILSWTLQMINHEVLADLQSHDWVASSFRGQVVFPEIFETHSLGSEGFLKLVCIPGVLASGPGNTQRFSRVRCSPDRLTSSPQNFQSDVVSRCVNLFPTEKIQWRTSLEADCLFVGVGWTKALTSMKPFNLLRAFSHACMLRSCPHKLDEKICRTSPSELRFLLPGETINLVSARFEDDSKEDRIGVYPVTKDAGLRLLSFCSTIYFRKEENLRQCEAVVNENACLTCLVKVCNLKNCKQLIL